MRFVSRWVVGGVVSGAMCLAALCFTAPGAAQPARKPAPAGVVLPPLRLPPLPGLSDKQKQQLEDVHAKTQLMLSPLSAALWLRHQELNVLWSEGADRAQLLDKLGQMDVIRHRVREILLDQRLKMIAVLTAEQRTAFLALVAKAPRPMQKNPVMGLEECLTTGECGGGAPAGQR